MVFRKESERREVDVVNDEVWMVGKREILD
jgi:hypothetical protein